VHVPGDFDAPALWVAVDEQRVARDLTWTKLNREIAWMGHGTMTRMREGSTNGCQHVLPLIQWVGRTPESFTVGADDVEGELLPDPAPGTWRWYWHMPELAAALDSRRIEGDLEWPDVAAALGATTAEIKHLQTTRYGTTMSLAMRVARWVDRTATSFMWEHDGRGLPWSGRRV
jgi:hypothetical protein